MKKLAAVKALCFAVENNLKEGKCVTTEPENFPSSEWKYFSKIVDAASKKYKGFIICVVDPRDCSKNRMTLFELAGQL